MLSMCVISCTDMDYTDWEVSIKYDLICGEDTLHFEDIDTISYHWTFMPVAITTSDSSSIIVRFMDGEGHIPEYEKTHNYKTERKSKIVYQHSIPKLNSRLNLVRFNKRKLRNKKVSKFDGHEVIPDTTNSIPFVPVI